MSGKEQFAEVLVSKGASYTEGQFSREAGWQRDRCYVTFPYFKEASQFQHIYTIRYLKCI